MRLQTSLPVPLQRGGGGLSRTEDKAPPDSETMLQKWGTRKEYEVPRMWLKELRAYVQHLEIFEIHVVRGKK